MIFLGTSPAPSKTPHGSCREVFFLALIVALATAWAWHTGRTLAIIAALTVWALAIRVVATSV